MAPPSLTLADFTSTEWKGDLQKVLARAARLYQVRGHELLPVGEAVHLDARPLGLVVLETTPAAYVAFCADGGLRAGLVSPDAVSSSSSLLRMGDFAPATDVVAFLGAVRRRLSRRHDLYLLIRDYSAPAGREKLRLYRASVAVDQETVTVAPAHDDADPGQDWPAISLPGEEIPGWMKAGLLTWLPGTDPFRDFPEDLPVRAQRLAVEKGRPLCGARIGERMIWGTDGDHVIVEGEPPLEVKLNGWIHCLAARRQNEEQPTVLYAVTGRDQVHRLEVGNSEIRPTWQHHLEREPVGVALVGERLLIARRDGSLVLFAEVGRSRIEDAWNEVIATIVKMADVTTIANSVTSARTNLSTLSDPFARGAIAALLLERAVFEMNPSAEELRMLAAEFHSGHLELALPGVGRALGELLRQWACEQRKEAPRLVEALYEHAPLAIRERVDEAVMVIQPTRAREVDESFQRLKKRATRNHWDLATNAEKNTRLEVLARFATGNLCRESHLAFADMVVRFTAFVGRPGEQRLVVAGRRDLRFAGIRDGRLCQDAASVLNLPEQAVLRHLSVALLPGGERLAVAGGQHGHALVFDSNGQMCRHQDDGAAACWGAAALPPAAGSARHLFAWSLPGRTFLEVCAIRRDLDGLSCARVPDGYFEIPALSLRALAGWTGRDGVTRLAAADGEQALVHLFRLEAAGPVRTQDAIEVSSPVRVVVADVQRHRILIGSEDGLVWCFDENGELCWAFRAGGTIRSMDCREGTFTDEARYAVIAGPSSMVLLDEAGCRRARLRLDDDVRGATWLPDIQPTRLVVTTTAGLVAIYRRPEDVLEARNELKSAASSAGLTGELARALSEPLDQAIIDTLRELRHRESRLQLLLRALNDANIDPMLRHSLARAATFREIGRLFSSLPAGASGWDDALFDALLLDSQHEERGDNGQHARAAAWAEALRRFRRVDLLSLERRLSEVPDKILADSWVAVEAGRAWLRAAAPDARSVQDRIEAVFANLARIKAPWLRGLRHGLTNAVARRWVLAMADLIERGLSPETLVAAAATTADMAEVLPRYQCHAALLRVLAADQPRWEDLSTLLQAIKSEPPKGQGAFAEIFGALRPFVLDGIPSTSWSYQREKNWLAPLSTCTVLGGMLPDRWDWKLARMIEDRVRDLANQRRGVLDRRIRPFPRRVRIEHVGRESVVVDAEIVADGGSVAENVKVTISCVLGAESREERTFERKLFADGEPAEELRFRLPYVPGAQKLELRLSMEKAGATTPVEQYEYELPGSVTEATLDGEVPGKLGTLVQRAVDAVTSSRAAHVVVAVPSALAGAVVEALAVRGLPVRHIDDVLRDYGPGRLYPRRFTARELLVALGHAGGSSQEQVVLFPAEETVVRVLAPDFVGEATQFWNALRQGRGRFVWVLPPQLAWRVYRQLPSGAEWVSAHRVFGAKEEEEVTTWLASNCSIAQSTARTVVRRTSGDLRAIVFLATRRELLTQMPGEEERKFLWRLVEEDLGALDVRTTLTLIALAMAVTEVSRRDLRPGMALADRFSSTRRKPGRAPKIIAEAREPLGQQQIHAIKSLRPDKLICLGVHDENWRLPEKFSGLRDLITITEALCDRLERLGFVKRQGKLFRLHEIYEEVIGTQSREGPDATAVLRRLLGGRDPLEGVTLQEVGSLGAETLALLGRRRELQHLFSAVAQLWTEGRRTALQDLGQVLLQRAVAVLGPGEHSPRLEKLRAGFGDEALFAIPAAGEPDPVLVFLGRISSLSASNLAPVVENGCLVLLGPGIEGQEYRGEGVVVLSERYLRDVLSVDDPAAGFRAAIRARRGLLSLSPFKIQSALPPGSPIFVGRNAALEEISAGIKARNYLIVGARQIGKTSLLNRLCIEFEKRHDLAAWYAELQGVRSEEDLRRELKSVSPGFAVPELTDSREVMRRLVSLARDASRVPVFLFNEIDGLVREGGFLWWMRGLADGGARFVFTGYPTAAWALRDLRSPLFHFTSGLATDAAAKAWNLAQLTRDEALELVRRLNAPPLELNWASGEARKGEELLLAISYCIPWVIQTLCQRLVMRLAQEGRFTLRVDDVRWVGGAVQPILNTLDEQVLEKLINSNREVDRYATKALISAVVHERYFAGDQVAFAADLADRNPEAYAFTASDARRILDEYIRELCARDEVMKLEEFFRSFEVERVLDGLCLTLILTRAGSDASIGEPRYCFLNHIYPTELRRALARGTPLDRLTAALEQLLRYLGGKK